MLLISESNSWHAEIWAGGERHLMLFGFRVKFGAHTDTSFRVKAVSTYNEISNKITMEENGIYINIEAPGTNGTCANGFEKLQHVNDVSEELTNVKENNLGMENIELRFLTDGRNSLMPRPKSLNTFGTCNLDPITRFDSIRVLAHSSPIKQQDLKENSSVSIGSSGKELNSQLLEAVKDQNIEKIIRLLKEGANPNATCRLTRVSACHIAALNGGETLPLLLKAGAKRNRFDNMCRTPLHLAAWAGNIKEVAILLDLPEDLQARVCDKNMSSETEEEVKQLIPSIFNTTNVVYNIGVINMLPSSWVDGVGHNCRDLNEYIPVLEPKCTPLHAACFFARTHCVRLLLAAGALTDVKDLKSHVPLEVVGCAVYLGHQIDSGEFEKTIKLLVKSLDRNNDLHIQGIKTYSPLHTAVELGSLEAIKLLLEAGVTALLLNKDGLTPMHVCVKKQMQEHLQLLVNHNYKNKAVVNIEDKEGFTVLHAAVRSSWMPGIRIALEAGADITKMGGNGQTSFHEAAIVGNLDVLYKLLEFARIHKVVECRNYWGETALYPAIRAGCLECVKALLEGGASIEHTLRENINVLHIAAHKGHFDILSSLLDNYTATQKLINSLAVSCRYFNFSPLHIAVFYERIECVKLLLSHNADVRLRSHNNPYGTPLHIAVMKNNSKIANIILEFDKATLNLVNDLGWYPLHTACYYASKDCIRLLLQEGADMSMYTAKSKNETALSIIMNNVSKPTEFLEDIFDSCIKNKIHSRVIDIDYSILTLNNGEGEQMKIIHALRSTGNRFDQKKLLLHPLIKSFLYLKWKALLPFFYTILILYSLYTISLTTLIMSVFSYKNKREDTPAWLNLTVWSCIVNIALCFVIILESIYSINIRNKTYHLHVETWAKYSSILLGVVLGPTLAMRLSDAEWVRHLSTAAVLVSWLQMMFLLSRFPEWGYYFLMFGTVASKILKILLTFMFLLIGFSVGFMLQFHYEKPFDNFWSAIVKTMVMKTSEFDYDDLFKGKYSKEFATILLQIIFLVFIIMTAIVLMNLMVGVAVNDVQNLEMIGNIKRIEKQIDLLCSLESLVYGNVLNKKLPKCLQSNLLTRKNAHKHIRIQLGESFSYIGNIFPSSITDILIDKALTIKKHMEEQSNSEAFITLVEEIYRATVMKNKLQELPCKDSFNAMEDKIKNIKIFNEDRKQSNVSFIKDNDKHQLNTNMKQITMEIDTIKHSLLRIEKYLAK